jgi:hypothetical protein
MNQLQSIQNQRPAPEAKEWELKGDAKDVAQTKILSMAYAGLDVRCEVAIVREEGLYYLVFPWAERSACPSCYGGGQALTQYSQGSIFRSTPCPRCHGHGYVEKVKEITIPVTPKMAEEGQIRLAGAGLYDANDVHRGDLFISLNFVEKLPQSH